MANNHGFEIKSIARGLLKLRTYRQIHEFGFIRQRSEYLSERELVAVFQQSCEYSKESRVQLK